MKVKLDKGLDIPVSEIISRINDDKQLMTNLESALVSQRLTNENLEVLLSEQQKSLDNIKGTLTTEALIAQNRIKRLEDINSKFEQVQQIFDKEDAQVFR
jgi:hypothetical protein